MVFSSQVFIFYFLPLVLLVYYVLPGNRHLFLLLASYVFYGWWNPWFVPLMLSVTAANYAFGQSIAAPGASRRRKRMALVGSVVASLGTLGFFKYYMFAGHNLNWLLGKLGIAPFPLVEVVLPIGISFYVFQSLSYTIDVYRGESPPVRSFFDFACFVALFPQ
ncbi:MAG: MBOAT family protein, partial [Pirellulales bacterium]|nr:MBOAT family protein [Pirellulales bacterium]